MLNFVILFAVLYFLLYKPVKKFMDDREAEYKKASDEAKKKLETADKALSELDETIAQKDKEASDKRAALLADAQEQYTKKISEAEKEAEKIIGDAREQADAIRRKAVSESSDDISKLAIASVKKTVLSADEAFEAFLEAVEKDADDEY